MDSHTTVYESRCPGCDVSFPVETRTCLHCGGRTVRADRVGVIRAVSSTGFESGHSVGGSGAGSGRVPSPGPADQDEQSFFQLPEFSSEEREIEQADEAPTSFVRTILRGLGGFVWVIVLIAFTLARNCGGD